MREPVSCFQLLLVVLGGWFLSALLLKSSVSKSEKKWVEGRIKVTKHHKYNTNFIRDFSLTLFTKIGSDADGRVRNPAKEKHRYKDGDSLGRSNVS